MKMERKSNQRKIRKICMQRVRVHIHPKLGRSFKKRKKKTA